MYKMEGLLVIHAEKCYLRSVPAKIRRKTKDLFVRIEQAIGEAIAEGKKVYFIAEESEHPYQKGMFPDIRAHGTKIEFITPDHHETQFLKTKQRMLEHGITKAEIAGISYFVCVYEMLNLLSGEEGSYTRKHYESSAEDMCWTEKEFKKVFDTKIEAEIIGDLTDKF